MLDSAQLRVVGEAATGEAAITLAEQLRPDVVLCDLRLWEGVDGLQTTAALRALHPALITRVLQGVRNPLPRLTEREIEVLRLVSEGATNREIARTLFVSEETVKSHLAHVFTKLDVDSRSRAIARARDTGLI